VEQWGCFTEIHYCLNLKIMPDFNITPEVLKDVDCEKAYASETIIPRNPIVLCFEDEEVIEIYHSKFVNGPLELVAEYCQNNCSHIEGFNDGWIRYCQNIFSGMSYYFFSFSCSTTNMEEDYYIGQLCDGITNCKNGADEFGCPLPDRFHCDPNVSAEWVHIDKVCDLVKDCSNGADECGTCQFGALSSSEFLIQSKLILAVTSIMGVLIIVLNLKEGYACFKTNCSSKIKAIDRIFLLQIFLYDGLMGVYLCLIVIASIVLKMKGEYCLIEQDWRASPFCSRWG